MEPIHRFFFDIDMGEVSAAKQVGVGKAATIDQLLALASERLIVPIDNAAGNTNTIWIFIMISMQGDPVIA